MNNLNIKGKQKFMDLEIPIIEGGFGEGKKCITDKTISEIHNMEIKHVRELINRNIRRFINAIDFIDLKVVVDNDYNLEVLELLSYRKMQISKANNIYLLSERGYSKLIKIMDTDLAWEIHDKIMDE
ncbi:ORF6N domain-containing protein, partial [Clostridioides difficile]